MHQIIFDSLEITVDPAVRDTMQDTPNRSLKHRVESGVHPRRTRLLEILGKMGRHVRVDGLVGWSGQLSLELFILSRWSRTPGLHRVWNDLKTFCLNKFIPLFKKRLRIYSF